MTKTEWESKTHTTFLITRNTSWSLYIHQAISLHYLFPTHNTIAHQPLQNNNDKQTLSGVNQS